MLISTLVVASVGIITLFATIVRDIIHNKNKQNEKS